MFTFAPTGRGMAMRFTQGVASLALGYGGRWAFSPHSLTYNTATLTQANYYPYLSTRLLSREPAPSHTY